MISEMRTREFILESEYDGLGLGVLVAEPDTERPEKVFQFAHGMCGCKERYLPVMEFLAANGVACVANDHRGHGASVRSADDLGYMYEGGYKALVDDMAQVTRMVRAQYPGLPVYLLGHSMGSMAARTYLKSHDDLIDGLVICGSPAWNPMCRMGAAIMNMMEKLGAGRMRPALLSYLMSSMYNRKFADEGPEAWTCSDPDVRKRFKENPSCNYIFTVNGIRNILGLMLETYGDEGWHPSNPSIPVAFLSGADDPCMMNERKFHDAVKNLYSHGYHNITSSLYDGMRHEILNEREKETVWNDILMFGQGHRPH